MIDVERIMKLLELIREGVEIKSVKAIAHKNKKGEVDAIIVTIPLRWAKKAGIRPGDELLAMFDPKYGSITYVKQAPQEES